MATAATASAPGTAQRRATRISSAHIAITGSAWAGSSTAAETGARQTGSRTPASIALASAAGIASTQRPSVRQSPASDDQRARDGEGAERRGIAAGYLPARDEQRGARRRPGDRERLAVADAEPDGDDGHREAERRQPGRRFGVARADRAQAGEHQRERAREADERGEDARDHGLRGTRPSCVAHRSAAAVG